jgi:hypothetical protein
MTSARPASLHICNLLLFNELAAVTPRHVPSVAGFVPPRFVSIGVYSRWHEAVFPAVVRF